MQVILSKISDPRNLRVWKVGFKGWGRAGNVPELAELIHEPPPLPPPLPHEPTPLPQITHRTSQGIWRSVVAISIAVAVQWAFLIDATLLAEPRSFAIGAVLAAPMIMIALDWATRRRQQYVQRLRQDIEHRMMAAR
jgi:hypothetical protein